MYQPIPEVPNNAEATGKASSPGGEGSPPALSSFDHKKISARRLLWLGILGASALSCLLFGTYMACFYLRSIVQNKLDAWDLATKGMYHKDRWDSNYLGLGLHFVGGAYMMLLGPLQFVKPIRQNYMRFHRWNGRLTALGALLTAVGGSYYVFAVGTSYASLIGPQANWFTLLFGLFMLICAAQTYRHAAWTKRIDQHKLWAYRVAGLCIGNIAFRIYFLWGYFVLGDDLTTDAWITLATFIVVTFYFPFLLLAGEIWRREQDDKVTTPSTAFVCVVTLLLVVFVLGLTQVFLMYWLPYMNMRLEHNATDIRNYL